MNKKRISKYTKSMTERQREQSLLKEIELLKKELAAQKRRSEHEISVLRGKLEKATRRVGGLQKHIQLRNKVDKVRLQAMDIAIKRDVLKKASPIKRKDLTKEEKKVYDTSRQNQLFIPQFMARLEAHYGNAFNAEQYAQIRTRLTSLDPHSLYELVSLLELNNTLYDSDATYTDEFINYEAAEIYEEIVGKEYIRG